MNDRSRVSVILPVYNRANTVKATLISIARQSMPPTELIIVDDGSVDSLQDTVNAWIAWSGPSFAVRLIHQTNLGASVARNNGIAIAAAPKYLGFVDSDDTWPDDFLERTATALDACPQAVAATTDRAMRNHKTQRTRVHDLSALSADPLLWMFQHGAGVVSATLLRAAVVHSLGGFNTSIPTGHDADLFLRVCLRGEWLHCPGLPVTIGRHTASAIGDCDHVRTFHENYEEIWARVYEDFVENGGGRAALPAAFADEQLERRWKNAARQWAMIGRHDEADRCYSRASHYSHKSRTPSPQASLECVKDHAG